MKEPLLLGRFASASVAGLAFAAAGSRIAAATSDLLADKSHAETWAAILVGLGVLVLALGHLRSSKRWPRVLARVTGAGVAVFSLGVFLAPGVAMLRS